MKNFYILTVTFLFVLFSCASIRTAMADAAPLQKSAPNQVQMIINPTIKITQPAGRTYVSGIVHVVAVASPANKGYDQVVITVDCNGNTVGLPGSNTVAASSTFNVGQTYAFDWDTSKESGQSCEINAGTYLKSQFAPTSKDNVGGINVRQNT